MNRKSRIASITAAIVGEAGSLRAHLIRGTLGGAGLKVANVLLQFGLVIVISRALGPEGYGNYAFALSLVGLLSIPVGLGLPTLVVREAAKYHLKQDWGLMRGLLRRANQVVLCASAVLVLGVGSLVWMFGGKSFTLPLATFAWALVLLPIAAVGDLQGAALRGLRHVVQGQLLPMLLRPGLLILLASGVIIAGTLTPPTTMVLHVIAAATALFIGNALLQRALPSEVRAAAHIYETAAWTRSLLPLSLLAGMYVINGQTDIVMLGLLTTHEEVGVYRIAVQGATLVSMALAVGNVVIAPNISRLYSAEKTARLQRLVTWSARVSLLVAIPVASTLILFGGPVLNLVFGEDYAGGHVALAILGLGQLVNVGMGPVALLLNMTGNERETVKGVAISLVANLTLNLLLIPSFGIEGAAAATTTAVVIWNIVLNRQVSRQLGIDSTALGYNPIKSRRPNIDESPE